MFAAVGKCGDMGRGRMSKEDEGKCRNMPVDVG